MSQIAETGPIVKASASTTLASQTTQKRGSQCKLPELSFEYVFSSAQFVCIVDERNIALHIHHVKLFYIHLQLIFTSTNKT